MKNILTLILLYSLLTNAQNLNLGFDVEPHQVRINTNHGTRILGGDGIPVSLHLDLTYKPIDKLFLIAKVGRTFHMEFLGWEYGVNGKYEFYKPIFISVGILQHSNEGGGVSNEENLLFASIFMIYTGIGIGVSDIFSIGINFYVPFSNKKIGKLLQQFENNNVLWENYTFKNMLRLSFVFEWPI